MLYVHVPLPHPLGTGTGRWLQTEYQANLDLAVATIDDLLAQARAAFGTGYEIDITADHPLRVALWCKSPAYAGPRCGQGMLHADHQVPFIVVSDGALPPSLPSSNVGVLR